MFLHIISNNFIFKILYLLSSFIFITAFKFIPGVNFLPKICIILGLLLIPITIIKRILTKNYPKIYEIPLFLFLLCTLIITLLKYPTSENIKIWIINLIILFVFFSPNNARNSKLVIKETNFFCNFYIALSFFMSFISIIMIFTSKFIEVTGPLIDGTPRILRYTGIFENENSLGICAIISIILSIYILNNKLNNKFQNLLTITNLILQIITLLLSSGRSAYLVFIVFILVYIFIYSKSIITKVLTLTLPLIGSITFLYFFPQFIHSIFTGRQNIWHASIKVINENFMFGVGNSNLLKSIDSARDVWLYGVEAGGLHNIYLEILTINGILSFILFSVFILISCILLIKFIQKQSSFFKFNCTMLFALCVGILSLNLTESVLIYRVSFISIIFWTLFSNLLSLYNYNKKGEFN